MTSSRAWGDAWAVVGVLTAVLLLARGARPFVHVPTLWAYGVDVTPPQHALLWIRLVAPAAIVVAGLLGWWLGAALTGWALVVAEVWYLNGSLPGPVSATVLVITVVMAALLSVPGGFRRSREALGATRLGWLGGAAALVALTPVLEVALSDLPFRGPSRDDFGYLYAIDSRLGTALTATQYLVVAAAVVGVVASLARPVRLRAFAVAGSVGALIGGLVLAGGRPFGIDSLPALAPSASPVAGVVAAVVVAAVAVPLIDRVLDPPTGPQIQSGR